MDRLSELGHDVMVVPHLSKGMSPLCDFGEEEWGSGPV